MKLLEVRWKVELCNAKSCSCGMIVTEIPMWDDEEKIFESYVIGSGAISKETARYIVDIHNNYLDKKNFITKLDNQKWRVEPCFSEKQGNYCWCGEIYTETDINIIQYGEISKEIAHHIVNIHNNLHRTVKINGILK